MREQAARERQANLEAQLRAQAEAEGKARAKAANQRAFDEYVGRIRQKVRSYVNAPDIPGNPEAEFEVIQLPTGEVLSTRLVKSSGAPAYDDAVQRAILKASPLPLPPPDHRELFSRVLRLKFRPRE